MSEQGSPMAPPLTMARKRPAVTILIAVVGLAVLVSLWFAKHSTYSLRLTTCFQNASGVSAGTTVKLAGVEVGRVNSVRAQPTEPAGPAAVAMELQTRYQLKIPQDAIASIASDGILGPNYIAIDVSHAAGSAIENGGGLPSKESDRFTAATVDRMLKGIEFVKQLSDEEKKAELQQKESSTHPKRSPSKPPRSK